MSYTLEYNRQFIRTSYGYIPCWLAGDNNVWTGSGRYDKRCREWGIFFNWVNVSEEEMLKGIKDLYNDYDQHWKRNGKWVTNNGLLSWIKSGCRRAATIEEILNINNFLGGIHRGVHCYVIVYDSSDSRNVIMDRYISTNKEMDAWSKAVKELQISNEQVKKYKHVYPVVDFVIEDLKHPVQNQEIEVGKQYILKYKKGYVFDMGDCGFSYGSNIKNAKVFTFDDLEKLKMNPKSARYFRECKIVDADMKNRKMYLLYVEKGTYSSYYGYIGRSRGKFNLGCSQAGAKKYFNMKEAEKDKEFIQNQLISRKIAGTVKVVEYDETKN